MDHPCTSILGVVPHLQPLASPPGLRGPEGILIPRFRNLGRTDSDFVGGFGVFGGVQRRMFARERWSKILLVAYGEMLPLRENRVTLDKNVVDKFGVPVLHVRCSWSRNERAMLQDMDNTLTEMLQVIDARPVARPTGLPTPGTMVHELGTARMGTDPQHSVVDQYNRCWDAPNVLVVDGACWPTSGWQNPTLTMAAISQRACVRLAETLGSP
jgi:choline dehydrogenase-like flavoprotein